MKLQESKEQAHGKISIYGNFPLGYSNDYQLYFPQEIPREFKSNQYKLQAILGSLGIVFVFLSFKSLNFILLGGLCIYFKGLWRKRTDFHANRYGDAIAYLRRNNYREFVKAINDILTHPKASLDLHLAKGRAHMDLHNIQAAYQSYYHFFTNTHINNLSDSHYWPAKANAIYTALKLQEFAFASKIIDSLPKKDSPNIEFAFWTYYFKGLFLLASKEYEGAIRSFKKAIKGRDIGQEPYMDALFHMSIAYLSNNNMTLAMEGLQNIYKINPNYKNISPIIKNPKLLKDINKIFI